MEDLYTYIMQGKFEPVGRMGMSSWIQRLSSPLPGKVLQCNRLAGNTVGATAEGQYLLYQRIMDMYVAANCTAVQLNWSNLRQEFPVLNPAQLHYIVSQYLLPPKMINALRHWTPSKDDNVLDVNAGEYIKVCLHSCHYCM